MKRDFRTSEVPDLNKNFRDYNSGANLLAYYKFSEYNKSTNQVPNIAKSTAIDPLVFTGRAAVRIIESNPYQGRADLKSASNTKAKINKTSFRLAHDTLADRINSNQIPITISGWAKMPSFPFGDGDAVMGIFASVVADKVFNTTNGNFKLNYAPATKTFEFGFVLTTQSAGISTIIVPTKNIYLFKNTIKTGEWFHYAVRVKSSLITSAATHAYCGDIISVFINGYNETNITGVTGGDFDAGKKFAGPNTLTLKDTDIIIAKGPSDTTAAAQYTDIDLHEFAVWSKALAAGEILSLYEAAKMFAGSGILSLPPRVQHLNETNNTIVNPLVLSNVDDIDSVVTSSIFDDTSTRIFNATTINYSAGIPRGPSATPGSLVTNRLITSSVASPSLEPTIYLNSGLRVPSASFACPSGSYVFGNATIDTAYKEALTIGLHYPGKGAQHKGHRPFTNQVYGAGYSWNIKNSPAPFFPFNESNILDNKDYSIWKEDSLIGPSFTTNLSMSAGFTLPSTSSRKGRSIIPIQLRNLGVLTASRHDANNIQDPNGAAAGSDLTGFYYWNWKLNKWLQKGKTVADGTTGVYHFRLVSERFYRWDWVTGSSGLGFDYDNPSWPYKIVMSSSGGKTYWTGHVNPNLRYRKCSPPVGGFESIPRQFYPGYKQIDGHFRSLSTSTPLLTASAAALLTSSVYAGSPMVQYGAPQNTTYFAKESERLNVGKYIQAPFILEKVVITADVEGIRTYSNRNRFPANSYPQDDYVFFLYRQSTVGKNIKEQLSSSDRYLVCSGNVAVYATDCWDSWSSGSITGGGVQGTKWSTFYGSEFTPKNTPNVELPLLHKKGDSSIRFLPSLLKNSRKHYPRDPSAADVVATEYSTGRKTVDVVMTPAIPAKRRYGNFWEHTQVQKVVSGSWFFLGLYGSLGYRGSLPGSLNPYSPQYPPPTTPGAGIGVQHASFWSPLWQYINRDILYASGTFSNWNPNCDQMTPPTDVSSSLNYGCRGSAVGNTPRWTDGKPGIIDVSLQPPDFNRGTPVFCSWLGGTTYNASPLNKEALSRDMRNGYRVDNSGTKRPWYGQRFKPKPKEFNIVPTSNTTLTPLGAVYETGSIFAKNRYNYSGEPWAAVPVVEPNCFLEINQINEESTKNFFPAEKLDPRTRNLGSTYKSYKEQQSSSYINLASGSSADRTARDPRWRSSLIWNGTRNVFDDPNQAKQRKTGYLLLPGDDLIIGLDAALAAPRGEVSGSICCLTGSHLLVHPGQFKITLVGSYVKDNKRISISSDQQLLNANVSPAIGSDRVTDQFLLGTRTDYEGTYQSRHMTGTMVHPVSKIALNPGPQNSNWGGKNQVRYIAPNTKDWRHFRRIFSTDLSGSLGDVASFQRFISCDQSGSIYYDSMVPLPTDLYRPFEPDEFNHKGRHGLGPEPSTSTWGAPSLSLGHGPDGNIETKYNLAAFGQASREDLIALWSPTSTAEPPNNARSIINSYNESWYYSFPYEPKYMRKRASSDGEITFQEPRRQVLPEMLAGSTILSSGSIGLSLAGGRLFLADSLEGFVNKVTPGYANQTWTAWNKAGTLMGAPKILVGSTVPSWDADGAFWAFDEVAFAYLPNVQHSWYRSTDEAMHLKYQYGYINSNNFYSLRAYSSGSSSAYDSARHYLMGLSLDSNGLNAPAGGFYPQFISERKPSGWKYGIMCPVPIRPSAKFRSDKFGQFRDMLEQRLDAIVFNVGEGSIQLDSYPIVNTFRVPAWKDPTTWTPAVPRDTHCSNLSLYSTSSLPYFDDMAVYPDGRNRSGPVDFLDSYTILVED